MVELIKTLALHENAIPWVLVALAFLFTWMREKRMAKERLGIGKRLDEIEKEYREDLKILLRKCLRVISKTSRNTAELTRSLNSRPCAYLDHKDDGK